MFLAFYCDWYLVRYFCRQGSIIRDHIYSQNDWIRPCGWMTTSMLWCLLWEFIHLNQISDILFFLNTLGLALENTLQDLESCYGYMCSSCNFHSFALLLGLRLPTPSGGFQGPCWEPSAVCALCTRHRHHLEVTPVHQGYCAMTLDFGLNNP